MAKNERRWLAGAIGVAGIAFAACSAVPSGGTPAGDGFARRLAAARPGETITLKPGDYGKVTFPRRRFDPAITIDAADATFSGLVFAGVEGVTIRGGRIVGPGGRSYGINVIDAARVRIERMRISGAHRGIVVGRSREVALVGNALTGLMSDGINVALAYHVLVDGNSCRDFNPAPAVYDAAGRRLRDGDHPDCVQAWSRPIGAPTSDLTIINNDIDGRMQGIFLGNHVRDGVDDGGFDRVVIRNNRVRVGAPTGIRVAGGRDVVVRDNVVSTIPGVTIPKPPFRPVRANIIVEGARMVVCGNRVESFPESPATKRCRG